MNLLSFLIASLAIYLAFRLQVVPRLRSRVGADAVPAQIRQAGELAAAEQVARLALAGVGASILVLGAVAGLRFMRLASSARVDRVLDSLGSIHDGLEPIDRVWSAVVFLLAAVVVVTQAVWYTRRRMSGIIEVAVKADLARLEADAKADRWDSLEPTPAMLEIASRHTQIREVLTARDRGDIQLSREDSKRAVEALEQLEEQWRLHDIERRLHPTLEGVQLDEPRAGWLRALLGSRFLPPTKRVARIFSRLVTLTAFVGLIGTQASFLKDACAREQVALTELAIFKNRDAARRHHPPVSKSQQTSADEVALDRVTHAYEHAVARSLVRGPMHLPSLRAERASATREAILQEFVEGAKRADPGADAVLARDRSSDATVLNAIVGDLDQSGPRTPMGRQIKEELKSNLLGTTAWEEIKRDLTSSPDVSELPPDAMGDVVDEGIGALFDSAPEPSGELAKEALGMAREVSVSTLRKYYDLKLGTFLPKLIETADLRRALHEVEFGDKRYRYLTNREAADLDRAGKQLANAALTGGSPHDIAAALIERPRNPEELHRVSVGRLRGDDIEGMADGIAVYEDYFPPRGSVSPQTGRASVLQQWANSGALSDGAREWFKARETDASERFEALKELAYDAKALDSFNKVGGVVFGTEPDTTENPGFADLVWHRRGDMTSLELIRPRAPTVALGAFHPDVIRAALAFAADGRPLAVTIIGAQRPDRPRGALRVLMHPALLNTRIGADIEALDHFAFDAVKTSKTYQEMSGAIDHQDTLYYLARLAVLLGARGRASAAESLTIGLPKTSQLQSVSWMQSSGIWQDTARNILIARPDQYNRALVSALEALSGQSLPRILEVLARRAENDYDFISSLGKALRDPQMGLRSGVRERHYRIDHSDRWLEDDSALWPMSFKIQATFSGIPGLTDKADPSDTDDAPRLEPYVFRESGDYHLEPAVQHWIAADRGRAQTFQRCREFVLLQRLFRAGLELRLGDDFPVERFAELARDVKDDVGLAPTPLWSE